MNRLRVLGLLGTFAVVALAGGAVGSMVASFENQSLAMDAGAALGVLAVVSLLVVALGRSRAASPRTTYW